MYFVDRKMIEEKLILMEQYLEHLSHKNSWDTFEDKLLLERIVHIVIEAMIDVGNGVIDGFVMRDAGSYEDIIEILIDENVFDRTLGENYKKVVSLRNMVVRDYTNIDHQHMSMVFHGAYEALKQFSPAVRKYLQNELGHVTAFIPDREK